MSIPGSRLPLVRLPHEIDYCLFLIKEELKSTRFFDDLNDAGVGDVYWEPHLDRLILKAAGLDDGTDETGKFFFEVIQRRSKKIQPDHDSIVIQAFKVYMELLAEKRRRKIKERARSR